MYPISSDDNMNDINKKFAMIWINVLVVSAFLIFLKPVLMIGVFLGSFSGGILVILFGKLFGNKYE